jgi:hypothetical protein
VRSKAPVSQALPPFNMKTRTSTIRRNIAKVRIDALLSVDLSQCFWDRESTISDGDKISRSVHKTNLLFMAKSKGKNKAKDRLEKPSRINKVKFLAPSLPLPPVRSRPLNKPLPPVRSRPPSCEAAPKISDFWGFRYRRAQQGCLAIRRTYL